jgi:hypothetical protein
MSLLMLLMLLVLVLVESRVRILMFGNMLHGPRMHIDPLSETAVIGRFDIRTRLRTGVLALSGRSGTVRWMAMNGRRTVRMAALCMTVRRPDITMWITKVQIERWISTVRMCSQGNLSPPAPSSSCTLPSRRSLHRDCWRRAPAACVGMCFWSRSLRGKTRWHDTSGQIKVAPWVLDPVDGLPSRSASRSCAVICGGE